MIEDTEERKAFLGVKRVVTTPCANDCLNKGWLTDSETNLKYCGLCNPIIMIPKFKKK